MNTQILPDPKTNVNTPALDQAAQFLALAAELHKGANFGALFTKDGDCLLYTSDAADE